MVINATQQKAIQHLDQCHKEIHRIIDKYKESGSTQIARQDVARVIAKLSNVLAYM